MAAPADATELIRVLVVQQSPRVTVTSPHGMIVRLSRAHERAITGPLRVVAGPSGLLLNGARARSDMVRVRGRRGDLTINAVALSPARQGRILSTAPSSRKGEAAVMILAGPEALPTGGTLSSLVVGGAVDLVYRNGTLSVINELDMEEYIKGVVPSEMSAGWHPEALKVQAVAARTYALYQRMLNDGRDYDVVAGVQDQVYRGRHGLDQRVREAVEATRGLVVTYQNAPILAAFSSTAAGPTEDAMNVWAKDLPYLKGVECPFDENSPYYQWRARFTVSDLEQTLRRQGFSVGTIATFTPYSYSRAGRVDRVRILHSGGELILRGQDLRKAVGYSVIPSTQFEVEALGREVVLSGRGSGHAVGLCQWGAKEMAEQGHSYASILRYYFPGTGLQPMRGLLRPPTP